MEFQKDGMTGLVIGDALGNQFVWVPCEVEFDLSKIEVEENVINGCYNENEFLQLVNYGGFFISRYEAGVPEDIQINIKEFSTQTNNIEEIPISQKGKIPWNFIEWNKAKRNAKSMYTSENIESDLPTIEQWKHILIWLDDDEKINKDDSSSYGNYSNVNFNFTGYYSEDYGRTYKYAENKNKSINNMLLSTGASERNKTKNIYDLAGNVSEFMDRYKIIDNKKIKENYFNAGGYYDNVGKYSISSFNNISEANSKQGFRIVLYLK